MDKMTPDSLRDAIHQVAGQANAPYTPPHLMQEETPEDLHEAQKIPPSVFDGIADLTDHNDSVGALLVAARSVVKHRGMSKALEGVRALRTFYGSLTPELYQIYRDIYSRVLDRAKRTLSSSDYEALNKSL
jgi:hypothetical protein